MPSLAFAEGFWPEYDELEKPVRRALREVMTRFQRLTVGELHGQGATGLHLEHIARARDPRIRTIRITGSVRGVLLAPDDGSQTYVLLKVLPHDPAIEWARKHLITYNAVTKGLETRNVTAIEQLTPALEQHAATAAALLFAELSDGELRTLGIDDGILPAVRSIVDRPQLEAFARLFPEDQFEVLQYLALGFGPEEVWRDVVAVRQAAEPDGGSLEAAVRNTPDRYMLVSSVDELEEILTKPFDAWRIFLHPAQRRVAYRDSYGGPAQVSGGPGTGKTVVALHRVKHLLTRSGDPGRILLTTYTTALADSLRRSLTLLIDDPDLLDRVDILTVNAVARKIVAEHGPVPEPVSDGDLRPWQGVVADQGSPWSEQFLALEHRHVVLAQRIHTAEEYLTADRRGRGARLQAAQRPQVWALLAEHDRRLARAGKRTWLQLCADAAGLLAVAGPRYRHVVVDEAQDLHPAQWRVLRGCVAPGPDDLFISGDPHQRIYDSRVSLRSIGISVTGRSSRLRLNYRSTQEILTWAAGILTGEAIEDLDEGTDSLTAYRSLLHGTRPELCEHPTESAEIDAVVARVRQWLDAGVEPSDIAVAARLTEVGARVKARLAASGIAAVLLKSNPKPATSAVRVATLHSLKGLEFRCVALIGVGDHTLPLDKAVTPADVDRVQHEADMQAERCLLFTACTRAREALHVSWHGLRSAFLPAVNDRGS